MKAIIATKNPGKIQGAKRALEKYFDNVDIQGISVESNVSEQPINNEIYKGAKNRIENLKEYCEKNNIITDLYLSIESGITNQLGKWVNISIALVEDNNKQIGFGTSSAFPVPEKYIEEIKQNGLSSVFARIFSSDKDCHNQDGTVKLFTKGVVSRIDLTQEAFLMALTTHINGEKWK